MYASSNTYPERRSPEHLNHDACALCTIADGLNSATLLNGPDSLSSAYSTGSGATELDGADPTSRDCDALHLSSGPPALLSPTGAPRGPREWPLRTAHQAKRARVENIIRDMVGSSRFPSHEPGVDGAPEGFQETRGPWEGPLDGSQAQRAGVNGAVGCWNSEDLLVQNRLQNMRSRTPLRCRRSGGPAPEDWGRDSDWPNEETPSEEPHRFGRDSPSKRHKDVFEPNCIGGGLETLSRRACGRKKGRVPASGRTPPTRRTPDAANTLMADILKYELSRAVSMSVDSIFRSMPLLEPPPLPAVVMESATATDPPRRPRPGASPGGASPYEVGVYGSAAVLPEAQTEALALVVPRPPPAGPDAPRRPLRQAKQELPFSPHIGLCSEPQGPEGRAPGPAWHGKTPGTGGGGAVKQEALGVACTPGGRVRCKVNSRSVRGGPGARHLAVDPVFLEGLCGPLDATDRADGPQGALMGSLFSLNDGLTTSHLKKAKLMFFYTRYPSSLVLRTFFHDVQFTRCITSQLIKWFSNFREFYYIQMEKQARQALAEGLARSRALTVGRESELFRALNTHFNKASDFQVPERFLEVAEITLREFYTAVSLGKDSDPSWKKPIYKVICKLDSNVPEEFKGHYPE